MALKKKPAQKKRQPKFLPKGEQQIESDKDKITESVQVLHEAKLQKKHWEKVIGERQDEVLVYMESEDQERLRVDHPTDSGKQLEAVFRQNTRTVIDEDSLKRQLGSKMWEKITTRVLDKNKLDAYIKSGEIDPIVVAKASREAKTMPWVNVEEVWRKPS